MIRDHTKLEENLKKAATAAGLTVPTKLDEKHQKMVRPVQGSYRQHLRDRLHQGHGA